MTFAAVRAPRAHAVGLVLLGGVITIAQPPLDWAAPVTGVSVLIVGALFLRLLARARHRDLLAPGVFFPLVFLGYYGVGSLPLTSWGRVDGGMFGVYLLAVGAFVTGTRLVGGSDQPVALRVSHEGSGRAATLRALAAVTVVSLAAFSIIFTATGIPLLGAVESSRLLSASDGYLNTLALTVRAPILVAVTLLLAPTTTGTAWRERLLLLAAIGIGLALLVATGNRGHIVLVAIAAGTVAHYAWRRLGFRALFVFAVIGLLLYSLAGFRRAAQCDSQWGARVEAYYGIPASLAPLAPAYLSVRSVPVYLNDILRVVPSEHEYTLGRLMISPLVTALPGHQPGIDEYLKSDILNLEFVGFGIAAGLLAPAYVDGGYLGVVIVLLLGGIVAQAIYQRARMASGAWVPVYAFVAANLALSVYGSIVNSFSVLWLPAVIAALFWAGNLRKMRHFLGRSPRGDRSSVNPFPLRAAFTGFVLATYIALVGVSSLVVIRPILSAMTNPGTGVVIVLPGDSGPDTSGEVTPGQPDLCHGS